jgi:hypothetical protein
VDADAGNRQWPRPEVGVGGHVTGTLAGWVGVCVSAKQAGMKFFIFLYNIYTVCIIMIIYIIYYIIII